MKLPKILQTHSSNFFRLCLLFAAVAPCSQAGTAVGTPLGAGISKSCLDGLLNTISDKADEIIQFVHANGCWVKNGKPTTLTKEALLQIAKTTTDNTDLFLVSPEEIRLMTGEPKAAALAVHSSHRRGPHFAYTLPGSSARHALCVRNTEPKKNASNTAMNHCSREVLHEFMHILFREFGNPALGGGANLKEDADYHKFMAKEQAAVDLQHDFLRPSFWSQKQQHGPAFAYDASKPAVCPVTASPYDTATSSGKPKAGLSAGVQPTVIAAPAATTSTSVAPTTNAPVVNAK